MAKESGAERRKTERIDLVLPVIFSRDEKVSGRRIEFRGPAQLMNLSLGGMFASCTYCLKPGTIVKVAIDLSTGDQFTAEAQITHSVPHDSKDAPVGMGLNFVVVDQQNRERLLRFFVSDRISGFYAENLLKEFPHLEKKLTMQDVALIVNLWEESRP